MSKTRVEVVETPALSVTAHSRLRVLPMQVKTEHFGERWEEYRNLNFDPLDCKAINYDKGVSSWIMFTLKMGLIFRFLFDNLCPSPRAVISVTYRGPRFDFPE